MRWVLAIALAGCAHAYRPDVTPLAEDRYVIRSAPDGEQRSEEIAAQYAYRQANELCPAGYVQIDRRAGTASSIERVAIFGRRTLESPEVTLTVRCSARSR